MRNKKLTEDDLKLWSRVANTIEKQMKDKVELKNKNFLRPKTTISNKVPTKNSDYKYENILTCLL